MSSTLKGLEQQLPSLHLLSLSLFLFLVFHLIFKLFCRAGTRKLKLLPSPFKLPIIGNLHQLGTLPHRNLRSLSQKHGPLMIIHLFQTPTLVVSSANAAREIMKTHDLVFLGRPSVSFAKRLLYNKDIVFAPYGEYWKQMRMICILQLLNTKRVRSFRSIREEETKLMIEKMRGSTFVNLSETLFSFTNDLICRIALGRKYCEEDIGRRLKELGYLLGVFNVGDFIPWLAWVNNFNGLNARVEKCFREMDCFLEGVIEEHVQRRTRNGGGHGGQNGCEGVEDFVDVMLAIEKDSSIGIPIERESIKAVILDMFAAGTDTSHTVLEWAMAELMRHPKIMKEVQEEIREIIGTKPYITEDDLAKMHYLQLVIKETLRLHPPVPLLVLRESIQSVKLQEYDIPAKTRVFINAWAIGMDPVTWEQPEEFKPKRFLSTSIDYSGHDFELIPFGAGRRGCPGMHFAIASAEIALANLLYQFNWTLPGGVSLEDFDMAECSGITVHKKSPLLLVATPHHCE